jgi:phosphoribosylamine--glycine ligase
MKKIAFAGTDGRTMLSALVAATATSDVYPEEFKGVVIRGTPSMPKFCEIMNWPVAFVATASNSVEDYTTAIITGLKEGVIDYVVPMPEALLFEGLVDVVEQAGFGDHIIGLAKSGAFIEGDKIACKNLCRDAGIPVADSWTEVDVRDYQKLLLTCLNYIHAHGGAVLKYPYSAGGKGARIILNSWEIRQVYETLIKDYKDSYKKMFGGKGRWPLYNSSRPSWRVSNFTHRDGLPRAVRGTGQQKQSDYRWNGCDFTPSAGNVPIDGDGR